MAQKLHLITDIRYLKILRSSRFKKSFTTMGRLPWDKTLGYVHGASAGQLEVWNKFAEVSRSTEGMPLHERLQVISGEMAGFKATHKIPPKPRALTEEQFRNRMAERNAVLEAKIRAESRA